MLRVDVDARMIQSGGIGRYIREIVGGWLATGRLEAVRLYGRPLELEPWLARIDARGKIDIVPWPDRIYGPAAQIRWSASLRRPRGWPCDVTLFPHFDVPLVSHPSPSVVVIHDLIHLRVPHAFPGWKRLLAAGMLRRVASLADRIITVSATSRGHIADWMGSTRPPIDVVRNGVSDLFTPGPPTVRKTHPYVLVVAPHKPHKNLQLALRVLDHLPEREGWKLLAVGPDVAARDALVREVARPGLQRRIELPGPVGDLALRDLYRQADAVLVPSLLEGFALPALEARACGAPVLAPALSWAQELCDAGVQLLEGWDPRRWATAVRNARSDRETAGPRPVVRRWGDASAATLRVLERVAAQGASGRPG
jgi:glycosyltransferase involved in cell wall biosynthesis